MNSPASEAQLRRLAAHGSLEDRDYAKKEASEMIGALAKSGEEPDWNLADQKQSLIWKIEIRQAKKTIKKLEKRLANESLSEEEKSDISEEINDFKERLEEITEEKEDAVDQREFEKERIKDYQDELGPYGDWAEYLKKPNQTQVRQCLEVLDKQHPDWEDTKGAEALVATLITNFPEIKKKNAPMPNESKGCLSVIVLGLLGLIVATMITTNLMG
jgi:phenylalanyl-tRNA synthetase alpha subunit